MPKMKEVFVFLLIVTALFMMCFKACQAEEELSATVTETSTPIVTETPITEPEFVFVENPTPEYMSCVVEDEEVNTAQNSALYNVPLEAELQLFIIRLCEEHHIDPAVVISVIETESMYQADAIGDNGKAFGLMQIHPRWHGDRMDKLGCDDLIDPYQNVTVGVDYLAELITDYGNVEMALVAYNAGTVGANEHWFSHGIYSSDYSKKVLGNIEELTEGMIDVFYSEDVNQ